MDIIMILMFFLILFLLMRNIAARAELQRQEQDAVVYHRDSRKWTKVMRILAGVGAALVAAVVVFFLTKGRITFADPSFFTWLALAVAFVFFAVAPYNQAEWAITEKGLFIYNAGQMIPWTQVITTGIQPGKPDRMQKVTIQIKKSQGEFLKPKFQVIGVDSQEEAKEISDLIREFVHALDRKKIYKRTMEERQVDIQKRRFY
ncbi:MAG: hypothetical protein IJM90_08020 [Firmicutes bacterium]|nr:hypothetical protein [Bacillota bacterium]